MKKGGLNIVILGLSLSSSWGNGHATTYRALIKALAERGHRVLFLEREVPWYASHRDLTDPGYCRLAFYESLRGLRAYEAEIAEADAVLVGSYVPEGREVIRRVLGTARGARLFYDIDTPVTLAAIEAGTCEYLTSQQMSQFELYLSFTGGPVLERLASLYGARAVPLYCSVDINLYRPKRVRRRWDLGYLGTYSPDRQPALERLLLEPARRRPDLRFLVAGAQYPSTVDWPSNVDRVAHLPPADHSKFYSSLRWTLNITRRDMVQAGYSPSVRMFEAAACGTPLISDSWPGLRTLFDPHREIAVAETAESTLAALELPEARRRRIGNMARRRILREHTSRHRGTELELHLLNAIARRHAPDRDERQPMPMESGAEQNRAAHVAKVLT